jgi:hypothetical protein
MTSTATGSTFYALGRYTLLYLEQQGQLERFYRGLRDGGAGRDRQLRALEALIDHGRFIAWARRLRYR